MPEGVYARGSDGRVFKTRKEYEAARLQSTGNFAAQRARINKKVGGRVV